MMITVPVGTRPEVIKLSGVIAALKESGHHVRVVATGQHSDPKMAGEVFADLGCPPDAAWALDGSEGERVGRLLELAFQELCTDRPDAVLVLGDTYTAPLLGIAARRFGVGVIHLEAGLRSFNDRSMEDTNRRMMVALATIHLAPTQMAASFLSAEGVPAERMRVVGNPVVDAIVRSGVPRVPVDERAGVLFTAHRATNVDDPVRLTELVRVVASLGAEAGPLTFPLHPRTRSRLVEANLLVAVANAPGVSVCEPLPYPALLRLLAGSRVVVTDSGGLQEEASFFGVPVVVLRNTTPRWESVLQGGAVLTGMDHDRAMQAVRSFQDADERARVDALPCPYGDGHTAGWVVEALADPELLEFLSPRDPAGAELPAEIRSMLAVRA